MSTVTSALELQQSIERRFQLQGHLYRDISMTLPQAERPTLFAAAATQAGFSC
jgi:hypothetical protein